MATSVIGKPSKRASFRSIVTAAEARTRREVAALRAECDRIHRLLAETRRTLNHIDAIEQPDAVDTDVLLLRRKLLRYARVEFDDAMARAWRYLADEHE